MDEKVVKFRVGVVVLATMILLAIMIMLFNDVGSFWTGTYTLYIHFPEAPGVAAETPVRKDGILIGKVTRVRFADDDPRFNTMGGVIVTISVNADRRIHTNERCTISTSLIGDAMLQFVPGGPHPSAEFLTDGAYLQGTVATNPLQLLTNLEGNIGEAINSVAGAGNDIGLLARRLNGMIDTNGDQLGRIISKTERAIDSFQQTMHGINGVLGYPDTVVLDENGQPVPGAMPGEPAELGKQLVTLPQLMAETRDAVLEMRAAIETANRNMANLERFTAPLGDNGAPADHQGRQRRRPPRRAVRAVRHVRPGPQPAGRDDRPIDEGSRVVPASECRRLQHRKDHAGAEADHRQRQGLRSKDRPASRIDRRSRESSPARERSSSGRPVALPPSRQSLGPPTPFGGQHGQASRDLLIARRAVIRRRATRGRRHGGRWRRSRGPGRW